MDTLIGILGLISAIFGVVFTLCFIGFGCYRFKMAYDALRDGDWAGVFLETTMGSLAIGGTALIVALILAAITKIAQ